MKFPIVATVVAAAAASVLLAGAPATAAPTGALGAPVQVNSLNVSSSLPPALAVLPSGTTALMWADDGGGRLRLRIRPGGSTVWGVTKDLDVSPSAVGTGITDRLLQLVPLGTSRFLAVWTETVSSTRTVHAAVIDPAAPSLSPTLISGVDSYMFDVAVAVNPSGRAVVTWSEGASSSVVRFAVLESPTSSWSEVGSVAPVGYLPKVAVADDGSFCILYSIPITPPDPAVAVTVASRCHTVVRPSGGATWADTMGVQRRVDISPVFGLAGWTSITARGNSFVAAVMVYGPGRAPLPGPTPYPATRIEVLTKASAATGAWAAEATFGSSDQLYLFPVAQTRGDGSILLSYVRFQGSVGGDNTGTASMATIIVERSAAGVWTDPSVASSLTAPISTAPILGGVQRVRTGLNGAIVSTGVQADLSQAGGLSFTTTVRSAGTTQWAPAQSWNMQGFVPDAGFSPAGRLTVAVVTFTPGATSLQVRTSAMPRPLALKSSALSVSPRRGAPVTCRATWSEARSATVQWLRNGAAISGATRSSYTPRAIDVGNRLSCRITATNPAGSTSSTSAGRTVA